MRITTISILSFSLAIAACSPASKDKIGHSSAALIVGANVSSPSGPTDPTPNAGESTATYLAESQMLVSAFNVVPLGPDHLVGISLSFDQGVTWGRVTTPIQYTTACFASICGREGGGDPWLTNNGSQVLLSTMGSTDYQDEKDPANRSVFVHTSNNGAGWTGRPVVTYEAPMYVDKPTIDAVPSSDIAAVAYMVYDETDDHISFLRVVKIPRFGGQSDYAAFLI